MLHILLLILKIIGVLLLAILGILILLLCMVLFMPAKYEIQGKTEDGIEGLSFEAKAHWVLHLFSAHYIYQNKKSDWQVRIGWKKLNQPDYGNSKRNSVEIESLEESCAEKNSKSLDQNVSDESGTKPSIFEKIKCTILNICAKIKSLWETIKKIVGFLNDDVHVEAFQIIKAEIVRLAGHWHPRKINGYIRYGFDDPYQTGKVLAVLGVLYPFYGDKVQILPDFEQKILNGNLYIKGHVRILHLTTGLWRLFFNHSVRKTYRDYRKIKP